MTLRTGRYFGEGVLQRILVRDLTRDDAVALHDDTNHGTYFSH